MTRFQLLQLLVGQARVNGFEFRRWYVGRLGLKWTNAQEALETLAAERRVLCAAVLPRLRGKVLEVRREDHVPGSDAELSTADGGWIDRDGDAQGLHAAERSGGCMALSSARDGAGRGATALYAALSESGGGDGRGRSSNAAGYSGGLGVKGVTSTLRGRGWRSSSALGWGRTARRLCTPRWPRRAC